MTKRVAKTGTLALVELGHVQVPRELRGHNGVLRGQGVCAIDATDDLSAVNSWLSRCKNPHTARAYRREVERLLLWTLSRGKPLSSLLTEDYHAYEQFMVNPQPADRWCEPKRPRPPRAAMEWRPFAGPVSDKSRAYAMGVIKMLLTYLYQSGYLAINPLATYKIEQPDRRAKTDRYLERDLILAGFDAVENLPRESDEAVRVYERARFLLRLLYGCGARPHEVVKAVMGDVRPRDGQWWWYIVGKRKKERTVVIPEALLEELRRYRQSRRLSSLPGPHDPAPLIATVRGEKPLGGTGSLLKVVRSIFEDVKTMLPEDDPRQFILAKASTHWLRHTFATHGLDGGTTAKHMMDALGHADLSTLSIYTHAEARKMHEDLSARYKELIPK